MTCKLIHIKQRGYKQNQIADHIKDIKFCGRKEALTRKQKSDKLAFVTQYTNNIQRIKRILNKHCMVIKHVKSANN